MKYFIRITFGIFLFFISISTIAQENIYTVLTKSGEVFYINRISNNVSDIGIGDKLKPHDRIKLGAGGYIVLVDTNLQSIELTQVGMYDISNIDTAFTSKINSISTNITKFILNEMTTSNEKYKEMNTLGAVVRTPYTKLEPALPKYGKILDTLYNFSWHPLPYSSGYIFRLFNNKGSTLYMNELSDTAIILNLSKFNLKYDQDYYWTVFDVNSESEIKDSNSIRLISPMQHEQLVSEIKNIKNDFVIEESALNFFLLAKFLSKNELNEEAIVYFKKCVDKCPNSEFYWAEYIQFLLDMGLSRKAIVEWSNSPFSKKNINYEN